MIARHIELMQGDLCYATNTIKKINSQNSIENLIYKFLTKVQIGFN